MIIVTIRQTGQSAQIIVRGHAEYAEKGKDIVCAGVSMLTNTLANLVEQWDEDGYVGISQIYPPLEPQHIFLTTGGNVILNGSLGVIIRQYQQLAQQYPENITVELIN